MKNTYTNAEVEAHNAKATAILLKIIVLMQKNNYETPT